MYSYCIGVNRNKKKKSGRDAKVRLPWKVTGKNVTGTVKIFKKDESNTSKFYVIKWWWQAYSTSD